MNLRTLYLTLLLTGLTLAAYGAARLYIPKQPTMEDKQAELDEILEREVLNTKANIQEVSNDELLNFQMRQKPSELFKDMFEEDPFRIGL